MGRLERANSFGVGVAGPEGPVAADPTLGLVAVVDPFSMGAQLAAQAAKLGYGVVRVFSIWDSPVAALIQEGVTVDYFATVQFNDQDPNIDEATNRYLLHESALQRCTIKSLYVGNHQVCPGSAKPPSPRCCCTARG